MPGPLENPANDVRDMADVLEKAGFEVMPKEAPMPVIEL